MIIIAGQATIKGSQWEEAAQKAAWMSQLSETETGCISYRFYVAPSDRNTFFIFEQWDNVEALARHFQSAHFQEFGAYLQSVLTGPLEIKRYEVASVSEL